MGRVAFEPTSTQRALCTGASCFGQPGIPEAIFGQALLALIIGVNDLALPRVEVRLLVPQRVTLRSPPESEERERDRESGGAEGGAGPRPSAQHHTGAALSLHTAA
jgi:hypothetical protein